MGVLMHAHRYEQLVQDLSEINLGEEKTIIIGDRAYLVKLAEVHDLEREPVGRVFWD